MTTEEIVERIKQMAIQLTDGNLKPKMTESEVLITLIIPRVIEVVFQQEAESFDYLSFANEHVITFTNGKGDLPANVSQKYIRFLRFIEDPNASWKRNWASFKNCLEGDAYDTCPKTTSKFTVRGNQIYYMERGQVWDGFNGDLTVEAVTLPTISNNGADEFDVPADFLQKVLVYTAGIVSEKIPISEIGLNIKQEEDEDE